MKLGSKVAQPTAELRQRARQLQKLAFEMSEAEDRERERLAQMLHDDLQQIIAGAKFHLSLLRKQVKSDMDLDDLSLEIDQMLKDAIDRSRSLSHQLSPAVLRQGDLAEILQWLADEMQTKHGLTVRVQGQARAQSDAVKAFLCQTAQELLFNTVERAGVREARIRIRHCWQHVVYRTAGWRGSRDESQS